ncbi:hypothetical protein EJ110_NYTH14593 [Nymphaea thermarum]|nr:hypothetical protein EJ110_NYTH14593 [Nymphaea thermarum]
MCLRAMSSDFFESVLPKPVLSGEADFPKGLFGEDRKLSCLGEEPDLRAFGATGLPLEAETGLSGIDVLKFGGASNEKPGISEGCQGLDLTVGEVPREDAAFLDAVLDLEPEVERLGGPGLLQTVDGVDGRLVGVDGLDDDLEAESVGLAVGVDDLAEGVEGLPEAATGFVEGKVALEVGVEALEGLEAAGSVDRPVGVDGLDAVEFVVPDGRDTAELVVADGREVVKLAIAVEMGLRREVLDVFKAEVEMGCLDNRFPLGAVSD